jgi:V8-like Glu-specific endopeptidase
MRLRFLLPLLPLLTLLTIGVAPAAADPLVQTAANTMSDAALDAYWTPERIAHAKPVPVPVVSKVVEAKPDGPAVSVPGTKPSARGVYETTGRLLFSQNGGDWICSATVVASNNASVIATARHCGFNGSVGSNFRFAPSYNGGNAPHGWWNWRSAGWATGGDGITNDLAFIVLNTQNGRRVGDVVGTNGIGFNFAVNTYAYTGPPGQQLLNNCPECLIADVQRLQWAIQGTETPLVSTT